MREIPQFSRLYADEQLRSPSGRFVLHYDTAGIAVIADTERDVVTWRAGAAGRLLLGDGGEVQVEAGDSHETIWYSGFAAPGAHVLILTDAGDLELLSGEHVRLRNSRTGPVEALALRDSAPAADITAGSFLLSERKKRRTVVREQDGWLRVGEHWPNGGGGSYALSGPLVDWLEQEGTVLGWLMLPVNGTRAKARTLCLTDAAGTVLWHEGDQRPATPVPAGAPYAYGGPELGVGARLRHQSLTSPSGSHTLTHQGNGDLVLRCNAEHRDVWSTGTHWADGGWAELKADGDLVVHNPHGAPVWRSRTAGSGARRLVVRDDGRVELLDGKGRALWSVDTHASCAAAPVNAPRGAVMLRGQTLRQHALTSADGSTVLGHHDDRRLVLFGADGTWLWYAHLGEAQQPGLLLDEDGMLRILDDDTERPPLAGPADELRVQNGEILLLRADGTLVWRNGEEVTETGAAAQEPAEDFEAWMEKLTGLHYYCAAVVHDTTPDDALVRLGADPGQIRTGTWDDLLTQSQYARRLHRPVRDRSGSRPPRAAPARTVREGEPYRT
ncbi:MULTISPECIES: Curculin domain-containing protein (mannose-binding) lectin [Streptomyces]|uniref:Curculin domain-containing protein (Mannose-binding) lectin n=1 Tax=Streptomyces glycanivorans TaxID=3033808 RepID=A0ABY9JRN6_9ACTN|nr:MULTISPECIES: Curculin domain-containing protein (mannose-binding) lectin [unclassified Streptomyces]TXS08064.1 Curculin domain-containing protein (mannose-binding) lectin [Streptomyces sp. wa22]WLQ68667.1 Curculin domain-containing protein (mannose-binding) lectin [Streptomyces sp. Alt3]WSQ82024.1 Curculin domain-containing protein (mannose-binding) lectin [Streptomyces sp. NBC_01213]WSQ89351.1 Curculin domain-containing protein (mannose-binding) lectin [Streptomyces sp. NBC_01212]